jgi:hypothetical protein
MKMKLSELLSILEELSNICPFKKGIKMETKSFCDCENDCLYCWKYNLKLDNQEKEINIGVEK